MQILATRLAIASCYAHRQDCLCHETTHVVKCEKGCRSEDAALHLRPNLQGSLAEDF